MGEDVRAKAIAAAYESARSRLSLSLDEFASAVSGFEVHPVLVSGEVVGALVVHGPEIHACVLEKARGRWVSKKVLRVLFDVIDRHGVATTSATTPDGVAFVERLGFKKEGETWELRRY